MRINATRRGLSDKADWLAVLLLVTIHEVSTVHVRRYASCLAIVCMHLLIFWKNISPPSTLANDATSYTTQCRPPVYTRCNTGEGFPFVLHNDFICKYCVSARSVVCKKATKLFHPPRTNVPFTPNIEARSPQTGAVTFAQSSKRTTLPASIRARNRHKRHLVGTPQLPVPHHA